MDVAMAFSWFPALHPRRIGNVKHSQPYKSPSRDEKLRNQLRKAIATRDSDAREGHHEPRDISVCLGFGRCHRQPVCTYCSPFPGRLTLSDVAEFVRLHFAGN